MGKKKTGSIGLRKIDLERSVIDFFQENPAVTFPLKNICKQLHLRTSGAKMLLVDVLESLLMDDFIKEQPRGHYTLNMPMQVMTGTFHRKANGKNTFEPEDGGEPILVAERNSQNAMDGDTVQVTLLARRKHHVREAAVTEILKRSDKTFVGTLQVQKGYAYLLTEDRTLANDIFIPKGNLKKGKTGDKAVVRIVEWPDRAKNPIGKVVDILGKTGENNAEMHAILAEYGLPYTYPSQVEKAAEKLVPGITDEEVSRRIDMRDVLTFTIDPADAKDFDDALSIREIKSSNSKSSNSKLYEVGVHIADVSYYVKEGSIIDREAYKRATSVYLVDRTVPMLPERLCNYICSLRPDEDKLTYSVIFHMNEKAEVKYWKIAHTVIRSNYRLSYEEAQATLEQTTSPIPSPASPPDPSPRRGETRREASTPSLTSPEGEEKLAAKASPPRGRGLERGLEGAGALAGSLFVLNNMAKQLRQRRFAAGAVDFDRCEVRFNIDDDGHPTSVYFKVAQDANKLIEEFMLLANRTVAESIGKVPKGQKAKTLPYRIHENPDPEKLLNLANFVTKFGHKLRTTGSRQDISRNLNRLLADVKGKREQNVIEMITLRAMMKAKYSVHNIGHYGLAFDYYTHFTSPIRRYPDLMVHRLLTRYEEGGRTVSPVKYEEYCEHCSDMEQTAAQAERASIKYKQVEYMSDHLGETFQGTISGVTEFGLYVEIDENKCEGMIPLRDLEGDYYDFDEKNYCLKGRRYHHCYNLGDSVKVQVSRADLYRKQLDLKLIQPS